MPRVVEIDTLPMPPLKKPRLQTHIAQSLHTLMPADVATKVSSYLVDPYAEDRRLHKQRMAQFTFVCEADDWDDTGPRSMIVAVFDNHANQHFSTRLGHYKELVYPIEDWGVYIKRFFPPAQKYLYCDIPNLAKRHFR